MSWHAEAQDTQLTGKLMAPRSHSHMTAKKNRTLTADQVNCPAKTVLKLLILRLPMHSLPHCVTWTTRLWQGDSCSGYGIKEWSG